MSTALTTSAPAACWACSAALATSALLCPTCGKVQPVSAADYFQVFGLARALTLDTAALERDFHRLSRRLHPDRFARASADEQQWSLANTALLNDAYRTLRDPIQRTEYLLRLEGLQIGEEHSGKGKSADRQPPADLLEEVFELNMQLEEMRMNQKMGENDPALLADLTAARTRFENLLAAVDTDLTARGAEWDGGSSEVRQKAANTMASLLDRRRYLRNLVRDVNAVLSNPAA
ncbi:Fe-S protein assembly co-chaperone HscB [Acidicapsa acidisoli]|uniref:Fe-S protein assembly co-chaperone HscB n=1 Tax=Acidicapsa acidisoli TaxID=1615681 RepID=UPI0021DFBC07|nr:Fe-S protein assembly co-chaperone HscB [Acidicapsa acidisoli]